MNMTLTPLRWATRSSPLALWQANYVAERLRPVCAPQPVSIVHVETHGDRDQATALSAMGGFGVFTKAIQQSLLDNRADLAVHSLKDLPTILTPGALDDLKERLKTAPDDGGQWTGPKIARWLAQYHGLKSVHDQRGWDALIAIGYSIQQPRPQHPDAATKQDRTRLKKSSSAPPRPSNASIPTQRSRSGRRTSIASA